MKTICGVLALLVVAGCSSLNSEQEIEAVRDYIVSNELQEVDKIRLYEQLHYSYVNEYFVTIPTRRGNYLAEFATRCRALRSREFTPEMVDVRWNARLLRAKFDTIRGCYIDKIYTVTKAQREELHGLGDAPGDEVFLDEEAGATPATDESPGSGETPGDDEGE